MAFHWNSMYVSLCDTRDIGPSEWLSELYSKPHARTSSVGRRVVRTGVGCYASNVNFNFRCLRRRRYDNRFRNPRILLSYETAAVGGTARRELYPCGHVNTIVVVIIITTIIIAGMDFSQRIFRRTKFIDSYDSRILEHTCIYLYNVHVDGDFSRNRLIALFYMYFHVPTYFFIVVFSWE